MESENPGSENMSGIDFPISYMERRLLLIIIDFLAFNGGFLLSLFFRPDYVLSWDLVVNNPEWFIFLNLCWFSFGYLFQVYNLENAGASKTAFPNVLGAGLVALFLFNIIPYLPPTLPPSRAPLFVTIIAPLFLLALFRSIYLGIFSQAGFKRRVLIVGAGWAGETIFRVLEGHGQSLYKVLGFIDDDPFKQDQIVRVGVQREDGGHVASANILGSSDEMLDILDAQNVKTLVLAITSDVRGELYQVLTRCLQHEIEIIPMPLLYEQLTGKVPVQHIGDHWSVAMPLKHPGTRIIWHATKRAFDLFWAFLGMIFLSITSPFIALAIFLDSPGPIIYKQKRLGRNEELFWVYKFRSMVPDAEKEGAVWADENDTRVTRVGQFLRKTHLDEFPQFINILKGEMSVVGPRPERPEFIEELAEEIPFYRVRLAVKPGMAGWGLIHQGYGASKEDALEKLQYDLYYIKHQSLWLDTYILAQTFWDTITLGGR